MAEYMQLISDDREFHVSGLQGFMNSTNFHVCGLSYSVVAIIGPQSSGKSTLLNHLFHTQFPVMNAFLGRSKTTRGIWLAKADAVQPFTLVMDLEGTDGREKEDDTAFEKQSCLFAFAVADIVLINMWCHDIGRQQAANVPLLETVFKAMLQLFSHRKTTLLFVIRDREETPLHILESILTEDILKIWEAVPKPPQHKDTPLSDFFNVEVIALCNKKEKEFKEQVDEFRHKCFHSPSPADRRGVVPASGFSLNAENIWKKIKENKDLDLPAIKVLVSSKRCEEIADNKFNCLESSKEWLALKSAVAIGKVTDFRRTGSSILNKYLSEYGSESMYYTEHVRKEKREHLRSKALQLLGSCYINMTKHLRSDAFEHFKTEVEIPLGRGEGFADSVVNCKQASMLRFDEECSDAAIENANWDASEVRAGLCRDIEDHASRVRDQKLSQVVAEYENKLCEALNQPVKDAFKDEVADTWVYIRSLLQCKSNESALAFTSAISGFRLDQSRVDNMVHDLEEYAMQVVVTILREEAQNVLALMINRFHTTFNRVETTGREDISAITREVHLECLRLLSTMAVLRLDDTTESIETVILSELMDRNDAIPSQNMASTTWNQVPPEKTLITPAECNELWRQFKAETESRVKQAQSAKVLAARQRCQEIVDDKFNRLTSSENQDWQSLIRAAETGQVSDFRQIGTSIFNRLLDEYTLESENYEEDVREEIRQHLKSTTLKLLEVRYIMVVDYLRSAALEHFKTEVEISVGRGEGFTYSVNMCKQTSMLNFDRGCAGAVIEQANWHASGADLLKDIEDHAHVVGQEKLSQVLDRSKNKLCEALSQPVEALFKAGDADTWASIRGLVRSESDAAALEFSSAIWGFELSQSRVESMVAELKEYAKLVVERKSRDVAQMVDLLMAKRFHAFFDVALSTGRDNISAITEEAQLECLKLLSTMAVIRLDYDSSDNVKGILIHELMRRSTPSQNMASTTWDQVPPEKTLIKPKECVNLWKRFKAETESRSNQALSASKSMSTFTKVLIVGGVALVCVGVGAAVVYFIWGAGPLVTAVSTVGRAAVSTAGGVRAAVSAVGGVSASAARGATSAARSVSAAAVATTSAARTVAAAAADVAAAVADVGGAAATVVAALMVLAELKKSSAVRES